jgi:Tol biopolymer transport system component
MKICPHCQQEHPDDALFCPNTGQTLAAPSLFCGSCGAKIGSGWKVCAQCGKPVPAPPLGVENQASRGIHPAALLYWLPACVAAILVILALYWLVMKPSTPLGPFGQPTQAGGMGQATLDPANTQIGPTLSFTSEPSLTPESATSLPAPTRTALINTPPFPSPAAATPHPPDQRIVYAYGNDLNREIYTLNISTGETRQITRNTFLDEAPSFSPDNQQIVFTSFRADGWELYVYDLNKNTEKQITSGIFEARFAEWLPLPGDTRIFFEGVQPPEKGRTSSIWMVNADGSGLKEITHGPADSRPHVSPDGKRIVFGRALKDTTKDGRITSADALDIFIRDLDSGQETQLTHSGGFDNYDFTWSPDGRWIAFGSVREDVNQDGFVNLDDALDLFLISTGGTAEERRLDLRGKHPFSPDWSPDSSSILFTAALNGKSQEIWLVNVENGGLTKIKNAGPYFHPEWAK